MSKKLVFALIFLVIGYAFYDYQTSQKDLVKKEAQTQVVPLKPSQIQSLVIEKKGEPPIEFKRDSKGWLMLRPSQDNASDVKVEALIEGLVSEKSTDRVKDTGNFGLNPPLGKISVTNNLGEIVSIEIGSIKNFEGNAYLKKNGESDVMVSSSVWFSRLEPNASAYRDLRLFRSPVNAVDKLVFQMGKTEVSLINSEAQWIFPKQPLLKVDQNRVREIISMLNTTEAIEIVQEGKISQEDLKKWNLQNPQGKLTIYREQKNPWSIAFGRTDKIHRVFTSEPSWVLKVSPTDWDKFVNETSVNYFRDRGEPFSFDRSKVSKISVKVNGVVSSPEPDSEAYRTIVSRLATMKIADFEPKLPAGYSFSDEVVLQDTDGKELIRFSWGKPLLPQKDEQSRVIAKSSLYPKAFTILEGDLDTMKLEPVKENKE